MLPIIPAGSGKPQVARAKAVQLADLANRNVAERRWIEVPDLWL